MWGPYGGYLATIALNAAVASSQFERPATFQCHFLSPCTFGPASLSVVRTGGGKRVESFQVTMSQSNRPVLQANCWLIDDKLSGFEHDQTVAPRVPPPESLAPFEKIVEDFWTSPDWRPLWRNIEARPIKFREIGSPPGNSVWSAWLRLRQSKLETRVHDALRQLLWMDLPTWNAVIAAQWPPYEYVAPTLELTVQFHAFAPSEEWSLLEGSVPVASNGLVAGSCKIWSPFGTLLTTGTATHYCRPNPAYDQAYERCDKKGWIEARRRWEGSH
jgi:acyl-CoA thioesterase